MNALDEDGVVDIVGCLQCAEKTIAVVGILTTVTTTMQRPNGSTWHTEPTGLHLIM